MLDPLFLLTDDAMCQQQLRECQLLLLVVLECLFLVICLLVIVLPDFAVFVTYIRNNCKDHTERII